MRPIGGAQDFAAARFDPEGNFAALVPMRRARRPNLADVMKNLVASLHGFGVEARLDSLHVELQGLYSGNRPPDPTWLDKGVAFLVVNGVQVMVTWREEQTPQKAWSGIYANPRLWQEAERDLARCRSAAVISEMGIEGESGLAAAFDRAVAVTVVSEALWAPLTTPIGILWSPAKNAVPMHMARDAFATVRGGRAALGLWMRWHEIAPDRAGQHPGIRTTGLAPLIGREIEVRPSATPAEEMVQHVFHLASGFIDHGATIEDGARLEGVDGKVISLAYADLAGRPLLTLSVADNRGATG